MNRAPPTPTRRARWLLLVVGLLLAGLLGALVTFVALREPSSGDTSRGGETSRGGDKSGSDERAPAGILWRGDFEEGLSQWDTKQSSEDDRIQVVSDPVRQGRQAARFEAQQGDSIDGESAQRSELALLERRDVCCREGDERWYRWQTMFAADFPSNPDKFVDFLQFKGDGDGGGPITFMVWGEQMEMRANGTKWSAPLERGRWQDFIVHIKWSPDPSVGFVEIWRNGRLELPKTNMITLDRDEEGNAVEAYLKVGLYRSDEFDRTGVLYHDGMLAGTSLEAVQGAD